MCGLGDLSDGGAYGLNCVGDELSNIVNNRYGFIDYEYGIASASTDFVGAQDFRSLDVLTLYARVMLLMVISTWSSVRYQNFNRCPFSELPALHPGFCMRFTLLKPFPILTQLP